MKYEKMLKGKGIILKPVELEDAEFILSLRLDENLNKYINKVENNLEKQKEWIKKQQESEGDYYFIIKNSKLNSIGTISLYNIYESEAEFGRWVSKGNSIENLESAVIIHNFGFHVLGVNRIYTKTVKQNTKVVNFHKRFGATIIGTSTGGIDNNFDLQEAEILKQNYDKIYNYNMKLINKFLNK